MAMAIPGGGMCAHDHSRWGKAGGERRRQRVSARRGTCGKGHLGGKGGRIGKRRRIPNEVPSKVPGVEFDVAICETAIMVPPRRRKKCPTLRRGLWPRGNLPETNFPAKCWEYCWELR